MAATSNRERILAASKSLFFTYGYSKVTMDEVAADLGMSKKTLYLYFSGKRDLFRSALLSHVRLVSEGLGEIVESEDFCFESKLRRALFFLGENLPRPSPAFFRDLQHDVREVWEEVDQARLKVFLLHFSKLFQEGIDEGRVREGINLHLLVEMLVACVQKLVNPKFLSEVPMTAGEVFEKIADVVTLGVLSGDGRTAYREMPRRDVELEL